MLLALALLFAAGVMAVNAVDVADAISCSDRAAIRAEIGEGNAVECYENSDTAKTATVFFGFASAAFAAIAAVCALMMAISARMNGWLMPTTGGRDRVRRGHDPDQQPLSAVALAGPTRTRSPAIPGDVSNIIVTIPAETRAAESWPHRGPRSSTRVCRLLVGRGRPAQLASRSQGSRRRAVVIGPRAGNPRVLSRVWVFGLEWRAGLVRAEALRPLGALRRRYSQGAPPRTRRVGADVKRYRQVIDAFNRRDLRCPRAPRSGCGFRAPDVALDVGRSYTGHDGVRGWWEGTFSAFSDYVIEIGARTSET